MVWTWWVLEAVPIPSCRPNQLLFIFVSYFTFFFLIQVDCDEQSAWKCHLKYEMKYEVLTHSLAPLHLCERALAVASIVDCNQELVWDYSCSWRPTHLPDPVKSSPAARAPRRNYFSSVWKIWVFLNAGLFLNDLKEKRFLLCSTGELIVFAAPLMLVGCLQCYYWNQLAAYSAITGTSWPCKSMQKMLRRSLYCVKNRSVHLFNIININIYIYIS